MNFFSVSAQTFDTCNYHSTFEKETCAGTWVVSERDCKQLLPYLWKNEAVMMIS